MRIKRAVPALFLFAAAFAAPMFAAAQPRPVMNVRSHTQTLRDRGPHLHDHSSRPHVSVNSSRA